MKVFHSLFWYGDKVPNSGALNQGKKVVKIPTVAAINTPNLNGYNCSFSYNSGKPSKDGRCNCCNGYFYSPGMEIIPTVCFQR
ncbi:MAG: hypothetical protein ACQEWG_06215 [Bacteroidota bacterium]